MVARRRCCLLKRFWDVENQQSNKRKENDNEEIASVKKHKQKIIQKGVNKHE